MLSLHHHGLNNQSDPFVALIVVYEATKVLIYNNAPLRFLLAVALLQNNDANFHHYTKAPYSNVRLHVLVVFQSMVLLRQMNKSDLLPNCDNNSDQETCRQARQYLAKGQTNVKNPVDLLQCVLNQYLEQRLWRMGNNHRLVRIIYRRLWLETNEPLLALLLNTLGLIGNHQGRPLRAPI